ncbi:MAG: FAD-dependent oxidoreductase, partial [Chloroflexota bacterium]
MAKTARFEKLLEPFHIGRVQLRNRMIKTGSGMGACDNEDCVGRRNIPFFEALARGGVGLIVVGSVGIEHPLGGHNPSEQHIEDDRCIPAFREVTEAIHRHGCPTFLGMMHVGPWHQSQFSGLQPIAASSLPQSEIPGAGFDSGCRGLEPDEVPVYVNMFVKAAERAQQAGFDGVEINAATCNLVNSFLSGWWNRRQDAYGAQNMENRTRFLVEIVRGIKKSLGQDFPVGVLLNGAEFGLEGGITPAESREFARMAEKAGADSIQVRAFGYGDYYRVLTPEQVFFPEPPRPLDPYYDSRRNGAGALVPLAANIKTAVSVPVITVGRMDPVLGEQVLREGKADIIGMTRRLIADPELPNKVAAGNLEDIAPCSACLECLNYARRWASDGVVCRIDAALGGARAWEVTPAAQRKKVLVVGGGPAGMEAARVAALRGHEVTLCERETKPGGLLPLVSLVKGLEIEDLPGVVSYLKNQMDKLGVKVRLGQEATSSFIAAEQPDAVILATGGTPVIPGIPGINHRKVVQAADLHRRAKFFLRFLGPRWLRRLTRFWMPVGKRVVIIGGAIQGCELAEFLVKRGRKVTIVETSDEVGKGMAEYTVSRLVRWLEQRGTKIITGAKYEEITDQGLTVTTKEGQRLTIAADTIIPALPLMADMRLRESLEGKVPEVYTIGDCAEPRLILDAIADG